MKQLKPLKSFITIEDISEGKGEAFSATLHNYGNSIVMGKDMDELFEGIKLAIEEWKN